MEIVDKNRPSVGEETEHLQGIISKTTPKTASDLVQKKGRIRNQGCQEQESMLDFQPVRDQKLKLQELVKGLTRDELRRELNEMYDEILRLIAGCTDRHVTFEPRDEKADDPYAINGEESIAWTLGHVIVHITASMEESASIASELARGVEFHGRSRWEVPWREVIAIGQCRTRVEESRRMCLASLEMWPAAPHMENTYTPGFQGALPHTCISRFASGLKHASDHLDQIADIVRQADTPLAR